MQIQSDTELRDFLRHFDAATLPKKEWTHLAHLGVGLAYIEQHGLDAALPELRTAIRRLNDAHGTPNSETSGYHETITRAYLLLLADFAERYGDLPVEQRFSRLLNGPLAERSALLVFYSRRRLMSTEARASWVEPDLTPIQLQTLLDGHASEV